MIEVAQAVMSLRPGAEWTMDGDDVEGITWHTPGVEPLTADEVAAEVERLQAEAEAKAASEQAAREAAVAHAKSLGFTDEMIAVMYPALSP